MSYVRYRRPAGLGALLIPTTKTVTTLTAPTTTLVKTVAPTATIAPITSIAPTTTIAPIKTAVPIAPAPAPVIAPTFVNPISTLPKEAPLALIAPAPAPAPVIAPTFVNPISTLPKEAPLDLIMPIPVAPAPAPAPTFVNPISTLPKAAPIDLIMPLPTPVPAPTFVNPIATLPKEAPLELIKPAVVAPPAPASTSSGQVAPKWVVGANCTTASGRPGVYASNGYCLVDPPKGSNMSLSLVDQARALKAAQASKAAIAAARKKALLKKPRPQQIPVKPLPPGRALGLRGRVPAPGTNLAATLFGQRPGGQVASPSVVAANCGAGQRLVNGACQADPGTTISPTTGNVAQAAQAQPASLPGPVTYSQWTPPSNAMAMIGPAPEIESTPAEDEKGVPVAPAPAPSSIGTKVAMGIGAAIVGFFVLKGLGVFRP